MFYERPDLTPPNEPDFACENPECIDGMVPEYTTNEFGKLEKEMVRCECQK